jgi:hypothetical protein
LIQINSPQAQAIDTNQQSYCSTSTDKDNSNKEEFDKEDGSPQPVSANVSRKQGKLPAPSANRLAGNSESRDIAWLTNMDKDDIIKWTTKFPELPEEIIRREASKAYTWLEERKNGQSKNPNLFLHNWLDRVVDKYKNNYAYTKTTIGFQ